MAPMFGGGGSGFEVSARVCRAKEGKGEAACKREFKLPWREAGPPRHHDDKVDSDQ